MRCTLCGRTDFRSAARSSQYQRRAHAEEYHRLRTLWLYAARKRPGTWSSAEDEELRAFVAAKPGLACPELPASSPPPSPAAPLRPLSCASEAWPQRAMTLLCRLPLLRLSRHRRLPLLPCQIRTGAGACASLIPGATVRPSSDAFRKHCATTSQVRLRC